MVVLISGVVLLTLKKPERRGGAPTTPGMPGSARSTRSSRRRSGSKQDLERGDPRGSEEEGRGLDDDQTLWTVGEMSDDEEGERDDGSTDGRSEGHRTPRQQVSPSVSRKPSQQQHPGEEGRGLMGDEEEDEGEERIHGRFGRRSESPVPSLASNTAVWR